MSYVSPTSGTAKDPAEIYRLVRERFSPMARFGGPLYAGIDTSAGISGSLYVGELDQWLWVPETTGNLGPEDALLSDEQVSGGERFGGHTRRLLRSAKLVFELFLEHLDRVHRKPTFTDLVETYLTNNVVLVAEAVASRLVDRADRNPGQTSYSWR